MSKKKNGRRKDDFLFTDPFSYLRKDTLQALGAIGCFIVGLFFVLAAVGYAGPTGRAVYSNLDFLMGVGFFLVPIVFVLLGLAFATAAETNLFLGRFVAGAIFFLSLLGLVGIFFSPQAGWLGNKIADPLIRLFDVYVTAAILIAVTLGAVMVMFDFNIFNLFRNWREAKKTKLEEKDEDIIIKNPLPSEPFSAQAETKAPPRNQEEKNEPVVKDGSLGNDENFSLGSLFSRSRSSSSYPTPPLDLLRGDSGRPGVGDIKANANIIKRTLANFGINVEMDEVSIGPSITRYALKPAEGVKLSRILGLQNDLSLALAAHPLRIEAPIPGKSLVGIEMPNTTKTTVGLASLIGTKEFNESTQPLLITLGRGISGIPHFANLAKAPHLLIAGTTGSGKSVTIHTLITSLLYRNSPDQLRFIMIDPKRVELTLYKKIPHLLTPVITDPKKAIMALRWAAKEMERRYDILERETVRDIQSYHKTVLEPTEGKTPKEGEELPEAMPYILIIIDELADIMSTYPRELEAAIVRLAQMSRAVGIHLILSTQRPSVEVITGLIKANIPTRVALQVASQIDSRTILDMAGAEKLLGGGDMLYLGSEMSKPVRLQSAFITEQEVRSVVNHLAKNYEGVPGEITLETDDNRNALFSANLEDSGDDDDLYEDARLAVVEAGKASASYLQRKLKVGYARAARLLDILEERGVIGPGEGAKPREVYGASSTPEENHVEDLPR